MRAANNACSKQSVSNVNNFRTMDFGNDYFDSSYIKDSDKVKDIIAADYADWEAEYFDDLANNQELVEFE